MKLYDIDIQKLLDLLDKAQGNVYLVTEDGNTLNLKSKLCQLYGVRALEKKKKSSKVSAELKVENPEGDTSMLDMSGTEERIPLTKPSPPQMPEMRYSIT